MQIKYCIAIWSTAVVAVIDLEILSFAFMTKYEGFYLTFPPSESNIRLQTHHLKMVDDRFLFLKTINDSYTPLKLSALKNTKVCIDWFHRYLPRFRIIMKPRLKSFHCFQQFLRHIYCWFPVTRKLLSTVTEPRRNWINMKVPLDLF